MVTIEADSGKLRAELKSSISEAKTDILKWVVGAVGFQTILIFAGGSRSRAFSRSEICAGAPGDGDRKSVV